MDRDRRAFLKMTALAGAAAAAGASAIAVSSRAFAQITAGPASGPQQPPGRPPDVRSLKERLSDKGSDEQRVDNCHVPLERRGSTPRPGCPGEAESLLPAPGQSKADTGKSH